MAVTVIESIESRAIATRDGLTTARRSFHVYDDVTAIDEPVKIYQLFGSNGLPNYGDQFPQAQIALRATSVSVDRLEGQNDAWRVDWEYTEQSYGQLQQKQPQEIGYVDVSGELSGETVDCWRTLTTAEISALVAVGSTYPLGTPLPSQWDIGGRAVDIAGEPLTKLLRQISITYAVTVSSPPNMLTYGPFVGKRNIATFSNLGPGRVLYLGASVSRTSINRWSISHKFLADEWLHMRQVPLRNPDGSVVLNPSAPGGVRAQTVMFAQPFPELADFFQISPFLIGFA